MRRRGCEKKEIEKKSEMVHREEKARSMKPEEGKSREI